MFKNGVVQKCQSCGGLRDYSVGEVGEEEEQYVYGSLSLLAEISKPKFL